MKIKNYLLFVLFTLVACQDPIEIKKEQEQQAKLAEIEQRKIVLKEAQGIWLGQKPYHADSAFEPISCNTFLESGAVIITANSIGYVPFRFHYGINKFLGKDVETLVNDELLYGQTDSIRLNKTKDSLWVYTDTSKTKIANFALIKSKWTLEQFEKEQKISLDSIQKLTAGIWIQDTSYNKASDIFVRTVLFGALENYRTVNYDSKFKAYHKTGGSYIQIKKTRSTTPTNYYPKDKYDNLPIIGYPNIELGDRLFYQVMLLDSKNSIVKNVGGYNYISLPCINGPKTYPSVGFYPEDKVIGDETFNFMVDITHPDTLILYPLFEPIITNGEPIRMIRDREMEDLRPYLRGDIE